MKKKLLSQKQKAIPEEAHESSVDLRQKKRGRVESKGVVDNSDEAELDAILNGLDAVGWGEEKKERKQSRRRFTTETQRHGEARQGRRKQGGATALPALARVPVNDVFLLLFVHKKKTLPYSW